MEASEVTRRLHNNGFFALGAPHAELTERAERNAELLEIDAKLVQRRFSGQRSGEHAVGPRDPLRRPFGDPIADLSDVRRFAGGKPGTKPLQLAGGDFVEVRQEPLLVARAFFLDLALQPPGRFVTRREFGSDLEMDIEIPHRSGASAEFGQDFLQAIRRLFVDGAAKEVQLDTCRSAGPPQCVNAFWGCLSRVPQRLGSVDHFGYGATGKTHGACMDCLRGLKSGEHVGCL